MGKSKKVRSDSDEQKPVAVQKLKWTTVLTSDDFAIARAKADAVGGKVKRRPNGKFEARVGTPVKVKEEEASQAQE